MPNHNPVDKYHDLLTDRLKAWLDQVDTSRQTYSKIIDNGGSKDYSFRQMAGDVTKLWLSCYDTAFGWMWPQASSPSTTKAPAAAKSEPAARRGKKT